MPRTAKIYISLILTAGAAVLLLAAGSGHSTNVNQFLTILGFAAFASALKLRIPGMEATLSPNFIFLLLAMLCCSFSEVVAIALVAALVQSLWAAKNPRLLQVAFSASALVLSASGALLLTRVLLRSSASDSPVVFAVLAGSLYFALNTALVSAVIGLVGGKSLLEVTRACYESVFPYFVGGVVFAGMISGAFTRSTLWQGAAVLCPLAILGYLYSRSKTPVLVTAHRRASASAPTKAEELVEV